MIYFVSDFVVGGKLMFKSIDQLAGLGVGIQTKHNDRRYSAAWQNERHLSRAQMLFEAVEKFHLGKSFQHQNLEPAIWRRHDDNRGAENRRRSRTGLNGTATFSLRRMKQQAT